MRKKRFKVYSLTGVVSIILLFTFLNVSWKTDKNTNAPTDSISTKNEVVETKESASVIFSKHINTIYTESSLAQADLSFSVFEKAITGFLNLKNKNLLNQDKDILTIVDFSKSSSTKRMWIIDIKNKELLLNTYVAHGQGSGADMATAFSNTAESHQSSLGFYVTNETYFGKHGLSLKLDGFDKGENDLARNRAIVVHGASYVSENFIKQTGRLGRSFGCPAVPVELNDQIINFIKGKTCLFINGNSNRYQSALLDQAALLTNIDYITQS